MPQLSVGVLLMSKTKDALRHPIYEPRNWGKPTRSPRPLPLPWFGLDTERDSKTGKFVCGWLAKGAKGECESFAKLWDLRPGTYFIWNLAYDIEGLVRDLHDDNAWQMKEDGTKFVLQGRECVYYHGKRFQFSDGMGKRIFIEASSFFNRLPLKDAAAQINDKKGDVDASQMSYARYAQEPDYAGIVDEYCAHDAFLALALIQRINEGMVQIGIATRGEPLIMGGTPGACARRFLSNVAYPKVIWTTHLPFLRAYCGGRFEVVKRGFFEHADRADIISAYPWAMSRCLMLTETAVARSTKRVSPDAIYGAYEIECMTDEYLGIFPCWKGNTRVFSRGEKCAWLARPEVDWLLKRGHNVNVLRAVEIFDENAFDGWKQIIEPPYKLKANGKKGEPIVLGAKVLINSMYGITIQLIKRGGKWVKLENAVNPIDFAGFWALEKGEPSFEAGQFYAPCYASTLTSMVRVRVLDAAIEAGEENFIASHTDSALLCGGSIETGAELGDWGYEARDDELTITNAGRYAHGNTVKARGVSKRHLVVGDVAKRQKTDLWADEVTRKVRHGIKTQTDWDRVSLIEDKKVKNNYQWEIKRKWDRPLSREMIERREALDSSALQLVSK